MYHNVCVSFGVGSVSGGVSSFVFLVLLTFRMGLYAMLFHLEGPALLDTLQFLILLLIAFTFRFRSIPMLAGVALVQAWVGSQVGAYFAHAAFVKLWLPYACFIAFV